MSAKAESPLKKVMAENQQFKSAVDKAIAEAKKIKPKDGAIKLEASRTKLNDLKAKSTTLLAAVQALNVQNEPDKKPDAKFDQKKAAEEKVIKDSVVKLDAQIAKLPAPVAAQPAVEENKSPVKAEAKKAEKKQDEEDEEDEDDEEDEAEEGAIYVALQDFDGEEEGDLPVSKGDRLTFLEVDEEDETLWWMRNEAGDEGLVLCDLLKALGRSSSEKRVRIEDKATKKSAEDGEDDEGEEEEEEDEENEDENNELSLSEATDSRFGQDVSEDEETGRRRSGKLLWKKVAKLAQQTSATDVLSALGALTLGYRASFLGPLAENGHKFNLMSYLPASLSDSRLFFRDLFLDPQTFALRARNARLQRVVTIAQVRNLPLTIEGVEIFSRHLRVCLFDGKNVLSNIHTIRATCTDKEQKVWTFSVKPNDPAAKVLENGEFFLRSYQCNTDVGILFECNTRCTRTGTGESIEISCGWIFLPLFDDQGQLIASKQYELQLNGGTPFEKNVTLDPFKKAAEDVNPLKTMIMQQMVPTLVFKLALPAKDQKDHLDLLPDVLIGNTRLLPFVALYREILADAMLKDRDDMNSAEPYYNPFLANFPKLLEQPDILDALRTAWNDYLTANKQRVTKDAQKEMLMQLFMQVAYPLCYCDQLPVWKIGMKKNEDERAAVISKLTTAYKTSKSPVSILLSADVTFAPLSMDELVYRVDADLS